jgi:Ca2+-binding RTX toxin-like protein
MSGLLDEALTAHGGLERWRAVTALTAHGRFGGLLRSRFPENRMANGDSLLLGGSGSDALFGQNGLDTLNSQDGVAGNDSANGGSASDKCTFDSGDFLVSCP